MSQLIDQDLERQIKEEIYNLVLRFCKIHKISGSNYRLYLHESLPIDFSMVEVSEIDRFYDNVRNYCKGLPEIVSNLSFEAKTEDVESDRSISNQLIPASERTSKSLQLIPVFDKLPKSVQLIPASESKTATNARGHTESSVNSGIEISS